MVMTNSELLEVVKREYAYSKTIPDYLSQEVVRRFDALVQLGIVVEEVARTVFVDDDRKTKREPLAWSKMRWQMQHCRSVRALP